MRTIIITIAAVISYLPLMAQTGDGKADVLSSAGRTECEYVQLWENGPKWALFNVGATITDYANLHVGADATPFYNFAEMAPYYNTANIGGSYPWRNPALNGRQTTWTSSVSTGISDVATTLWGSCWKTPTREQLDTLYNSSYNMTTWTWCDGSTTQYVPGCTLSGYMVCGVGDYADKSIFLPATGCFYHDHDKIYGASSYGDYWTGTLCDSTNAYSFGFLEDRRRNLEPFERTYGESIRPVLAEGSNPTSIQNVTAAPKQTIKFIRNRQLIIERAGIRYNALGMRF